MEPSPQHVVGVISDTHGLVRPEAIEKLCGCDLIVHCGDIGSLAVLDALRAVAPVRAVRGNNDKGSWASELPTDDVIEVGSHTLYVTSGISVSSPQPRGSRQCFPATPTGRSSNSVRVFSSSI